ncbi:MAG: hypothetical protein CALGDGBN_03170 [Pseudomonadales bacterium]|nr:hypothetical protein [Pseudomonadales bacterium]
MKASLSARVRGSIGTNTVPVIEAATIASTNSGWLRSAIAKWSPGCMPRARSQAARRLPLANRSA